MPGKLKPKKVSSERGTFASVTNVRCRCNYLQRAEADPSVPIKFDRLTGEYQFRYVEEGCEGFAMLVIYHCPFCGGAAPKSKRPLLFHVISPIEEQRLTELIGDAKTVRGVIRKLGEPNYDDPQGCATKWPESSGLAPRTQYSRTLCYTMLSDVADVCFQEHPDGRVTLTLLGKEKRSTRKTRRVKR